MCHEVGFDFGGVGVGQGVDILEYRAYGTVDVGSLDGSCQLGARGFHAGRVERTADFEDESAFRAGSLEGFAGGVDSGGFAGNHELAGAVVVRAHDNAVDSGANLFHFFIGKGKYGCHGAVGEFACFLHGAGTCGDKAQAVFEVQRSGCHQCGEFAERVAGDHVGAEVGAEALGQNDAVEEDGRLGHLGLAQVFIGACEHKVGDAEAENLVGTLEEFAGFGVVIVEVFAHAHELGALAGKNVCFHAMVVFDFLNRFKQLYKMFKIRPQS